MGVVCNCRSQGRGSTPLGVRGAVASFIVRTARMYENAGSGVNSLHPQERTAESPRPNISRRQGIMLSVKNRGASARHAGARACSQWNPRLSRDTHPYPALPINRHSTREHKSRRLPLNEIHSRARKNSRPQPSTSLCSLQKDPPRADHG